MRKLVMMLAVMALLMAFPAAAGAKKPPPGQEPFPGSTCQKWFEDEDHDDALWLIDHKTDDFVLKLEGDQRAACVDVTSFEGEWNFEIDEVAVASFNMQIKDSVPGDMCWRDTWTKTKKTDLPDSVSTPEAIPEATINACPGDDFSDDAESLVFMVGYGPERGTTAGILTVCVDLPPFDNFEFCPED